MTGGLNLILSPQLKTEVQGRVGRGVQSVGIDDLGHLIFTMTDGQSMDMGKVGIIPEMSGNAGKVLTNDGTDAIWGSAFPSMAGHSGQLLTTDGSAASWRNTIQASAADQIGLIVKGASGQTSDLLQILDSEGGIKAYINSIGDMRTGGKFGTSYGVYYLGGISNAYVNTAATGTIISRNIADANSALTVNLAHADSTGYIEKWQFAGSTVAYMAKAGSMNAQYFTPLHTSYGLISANGVASANIYPSANGAVISRNVADANSALTINQANAGSTGKIVDFQFGGVSKASVDKSGGLTANSSIFTASAADQIGLEVRGVVGQTAALQSWKNSSGVTQASISPSGLLSIGAQLSTPLGISNSATSANAFVGTPTTGITISRNIADANPALAVDLANAGATANIAEFKFGGVKKAHIDNMGSIAANAVFVNGVYSPSGGVYGKIEMSSTGPVISRNIADAYPALVVNQVNAASTGKIADFQFGGVSKAYVRQEGYIVAPQLWTTSILNSTSGNNGTIYMANDSVYVSRNVADANPTMTVRQLNAGSTGAFMTFVTDSAAVSKVLHDGTFKGPHASNDGSAGITETISGIFTLTVKNGLITAVTYG